jgi:phosphoribosyl-dephospho-CoA transferase
LYSSKILKINPYKSVLLKIFLSEFCRLKRATPTEWYVLLLEEKSLKTTVNIKKENIISTGRVIDIDTLRLNSDIVFKFDFINI